MGSPFIGWNEQCSSQCVESSKEQKRKQWKRTKRKKPSTIKGQILHNPQPPPKKKLDNKAAAAREQEKGVRTAVVETSPASIEAARCVARLDGSAAIAGDETNNFFASSYPTACAAVSNAPRYACNRHARTHAHAREHPHTPKKIKRMEIGAIVDRLLECK